MNSIDKKATDLYDIPPVIEGSIPPSEDEITFALKRKKENEKRMLHDKIVILCNRTHIVNETYWANCARKIKEKYKISFKEALLTMINWSHDGKFKIKKTVRTNAIFDSYKILNFEELLNSGDFYKSKF